MALTVRSALNPLLFGAVLVCPTLTSGSAWAADARLRFVKRNWGVGEVRVVERGRERLVERYPRPIAVEASEVSPDAHWAFVWYRADRGPLQLAIYDLHTSRRTARFAPGVGGEMHFTPHGNIVLRWGCGSNCAGLLLYDPHGKKLLETGGGWVEVSPTRRFAVTGPSFPDREEPIVLHDLDAVRTVFTKHAPRDDDFTLEGTRWDDERGVVVLTIQPMHASRPQRIAVRVASRSTARRRGRPSPGRSP